MWGVGRLGVAACAAFLVGCKEAGTSVPTCDRGTELDGTPIAACLLAAHTINEATYDAAKPVIDRAVAVRDSMRPLPTSAYLGGDDIARALNKLDNYYARGILDSTRFDRVVDVINVATANALGQVHSANNLYYPTQTLGLIWALERQPGYGLFFQPVTTLNETGLYTNSIHSTTDSLVRSAEAFYRYATWVTSHDGQRFPIWSYDFDWAAGVSLQGPWRSGLAQGLALQSFVNLYKRTGDAKWKSRAMEVAVSLKEPWSDGGVLLVDEDGAWWEEYHPMIRIWNGDVWTLLAIGEYLKVQPDTTLARLYTLGLFAAERYGQLYDTGTWLKYSRAELVSQIYRTMEVGLAQQLAAQSGDSWFTWAAARWATYTPPTGVPVGPALDVPSDLNEVLTLALPPITGGSRSPAARGRPAPAAAAPAR